ncbi:MAG: ABC transporter substrate-binding protein [Aureispira sp.]
MRFLLCLCCSYLIIACQSSSKPVTDPPTQPWDTVKLQHATNFTIQKQGKNTLLTIGAAWKNATPTFQYLLYPKDSTPPTAYPNATKIGVPVERILCSGSVDVAFLQALGATKQIIGLSNGQYLYDSTIRARLASGVITNIGQDQGINYEKAITTDPDLAFVYSTGDQKVYKKYQTLNIPTVMLSDFMETTPLGRAEWLLFVSYFVGKENAAQTYFNGVAQRYQAAKMQAGYYSYSPKVFTGAVYKGTWYIAGGRSLMATFIKDAAGQYLWQDNEEVSGVPLDFEAVYAKALDADIWINQSHYADKTNLLAADPKYKDFKAVQTNQLYNYYKRASANGGTDVFESAIVRPDLVLQDLIHVFHERPVVSDRLYYYLPLTSN